MTISNYNTGFPNGVTVRNVPILDMQNGDGNVFWVDYETGSNENKGTFTFPFKTLKYALTRVVADQADKIYLAAGHTETITATDTLDINKRGVQIIGLGLGETRPRFTLSDSTAAKITISANNSYLANIIFLNAQSGLLNMIDNTGFYVVMENCLLNGETYTVDDYIKTEGSSFRMINCEISSPGIGSHSAVLYTYSTLNDQYLDCNFHGNFAEACIEIPSGLSGSGVKELFVNGGRYDNLADTSASFFLKSSTTNCTGQISDSTTIRVANPEKLPIYCVSGCSIGRGKQGDIISFSSVIPAAKIDGTSAYLLEGVNGSFYIEDAIIETSSTPLATGTGIQMDIDADLYGVTTFYEEVIANLGANSTVALKDASVTSTTAIIDNDSTLTINNTSGGSFTGGDIKVTFVFRLLEDGSTIIKNPSY